MRRARTVLILALSFGISGCATWELVREDPRAFIERHPSEVVVLRQSADAVRVRSPRLDAQDRIVGERWGVRGVTEVIPLDDVSGLRARDFHPGRTVGLVLVPAFAIFAVAFEAAWGS